MDVSFVVPLFNEEGNVRLLYQEIREVMGGLSLQYEVIFVDDGSTDGTYEELKRLFEHNDNVRIVKFRRNFKKAAAYSAGFRYAKGEVIITLDGDLQDDPAQVPLFLEKIEQGYELVSGWRYNRQASLEKTVASRIFNKVVARLTGIELHDFNCPYKAYRREVAQDLKIYGELHRYIPVLAHKKGYKIVELRVVNRPRRSGESKYGIERWWRGLLDAMTVLLISKYGERPLHFFGSAGLILFLAGFGIDAFVVLRKLLIGVPFAHSMGLLTLGIIILGASFNLFAVGLILEFVLGRMISPREQYEVECLLER